MPFQAISSHDDLSLCDYGSHMVISFMYMTAWSEEPEVLDLTVLKIWAASHDDLSLCDYVSHMVILFMYMTAWSEEPEVLDLTVLKIWAAIKSINNLLQENLPHHVLNKMVDVFQIFKCIFLKADVCIRLKFHYNFFLVVPLMISQYWFG